MIWFSLLLAFSLSGFRPLAEYNAFKKFDSGKLPDSKKAWNRLVEADPANKDYLFNSAATAHKLGEFEAAVKYFEKVTKLDLLSSFEKEQAYFNLGCSQTKQKKYKEAIESFESALNENSNNERAKKNIEILKKLLEQEEKKQEQKKDSSKDSGDEKEREKDKQKKEGTGQNSADQEEPENQKKDKSEHNDSSKKTTDQQKEEQAKQAEKDQSKDQSSKEEGEKKGADSQRDDRKEDSGGETGAPSNDEDAEKDKDQSGDDIKHETPNSEEQQDSLAEIKEQEEEIDPLNEQEKEIAKLIEDQDKKAGKYARIKGLGASDGW